MYPRNIERPRKLCGTYPKLLWNASPLRESIRSYSPAAASYPACS